MVVGVKVWQNGINKTAKGIRSYHGLNKDQSKQSSKRVGTTVPESGFDLQPLNFVHRY